MKRIGLGKIQGPSAQGAEGYTRHCLCQSCVRVPDADSGGAVFADFRGSGLRQWWFSGRAVRRVAGFGEQGRSEMQALAEMEAGWVEREVHGHGPELQLIASAAAAVAEEDVLADVNREAGVGSVVRRVERAGTTPLVTTDVEGGVVQFFKHRTDGDLSAQGAVVETRHARDFTGAWGN